MANIKSSKKRARQAIGRRAKNVKRMSEIRTAVKKVNDALEKKVEKDEVMILFRAAEAKIARAKGKKVFHRNTASRKIGRLAKQINVTYK